MLKLQHQPQRNHRVVDVTTVRCLGQLIRHTYSAIKLLLESTRTLAWGRMDYEPRLFKIVALAIPRW